jgi:hypothetical protein
VQRALKGVAGMLTHLHAVVVKNGWAVATSDDVASMRGGAPMRFEQCSRDHVAAWAPAPGGG